MKTHTIRGKRLKVPVFFPDATRGVIRSLDSADLANVGIKGLIVNTFHLMTQPGLTVVKKLGGIKKMMGWDGFVFSDSGGFQVLSLIHDGKLNGSISDAGVVFTRSFKRKKKKHNFTPEKSIQMQFALGSDVMVCFDDCPGQYASDEDVRASTTRTIEWAKRSKEEYLRLVEQYRYDEESRPRILGVIQGGDSIKQRTRCAQSLEEIGFDGYGFGGWPLTHDKTLNEYALKLTADLMPDDKPKYALGVGNPQAVVDCAAMGYTVFDCTLPTRDARHKRLYVLNADPKVTDLTFTRPVYDYVHIMEERYVRSDRPISEYCDCSTCKRYSTAYLHHLFTIGDSTAHRLATIHNLRTYMLLMENLRSYKLTG